MTAETTQLDRHGAWSRVDATNRSVTMCVPCVPAPKGSAHAALVPLKGARKCPVCQQTPSRSVYLEASSAAGATKQKEQEKAIRSCILLFRNMEPLWCPYNEPLSVATQFVLQAPDARMRECFHGTYPDVDKLLRQLLDCISAPRKNKVPIYDKPNFLVVNDSAISKVSVEKQWLHNTKMQFPGVMFQIVPREGRLL